MLDIGNIETTSSDTSGDKERAATRTEGTPVEVLVLKMDDDGMYSQSIFTFTLSTIRVDRGHRQALVVEEVVDHVALDLGVGKDQDALRLVREDEVEQSLLLLVLVDIDDLLLDVLVSATDTTDLDRDVGILHVLLSKTAGRLGEGGGEHEVGVIRIGVDI